MPEPVFFQHFQVQQKPDGGLHELGRGAMGITYKAFDTNLQCPVALKIINAALTNNEHARERFLREARAAARLRHPNVATVLHLGKDEQSFFYAMEFIEGETLEAFVARQGPLPPALALQVVLQVARALGAAQNEGLVHRDIKPANVMLVRHRGEDEDEGVHIKVIDFGLAKFVDKSRNNVDSLNLTMAGGFVGSPYFASPEQVDESEIDTRSDIYSLGATLWYLLAGEPPFTGSLGQVLAQHLQRQPPYEKLEARGIPAPVLTLLRRLLAKNPDDRPADPAVLRREVTACLRALGAPTGSSAAGSGASEGLLATHYLVLSDLGETEKGRVFRAQDRRDSRTVDITRLLPGSLGDAATVAGIERLVEIARTRPVAGLVAVQALERAADGDFLVTEPIQGFSLLEALRARGKFGADEALLLLRRIADIVTAAAAVDLRELPLNLRAVHVHFPGGLLGDAGKRAALEGPVNGWPPFELKLDAVHFENSSLPTLDSSALTQVPSRPPPLELSNPNSYGLGYSSIRPLAELIYELLGGTLPASGGPLRYPPLSNLSEESNTVLHRALTQADQFYWGLSAFVEAMSKGELTLPVSRASLPEGYTSWQAAAEAAAAGAFDAPPSLPPVQNSVGGGSNAGGSRSAAGSSSAAGTIGPPPLPPVLPSDPPSASVLPQAPRLPPQTFKPAQPKSGMGKSCLIAAGIVGVIFLILAAGVVALVGYGRYVHVIRHQAEQTDNQDESPTPRVHVNGLDKLDKQLEKLEKMAESMDGKHASPTPEPDDDETPAPTVATPPLSYSPPPAPTLPPQQPQPYSSGISGTRPIPITSYRARLSERDHRSAAGRLTSASEILRQDRANYYRYKQADPEDQNDALFANPVERARLEKIQFPKNINDAIVDGTPFVQVDVYPNGVYVTILAR